MNNKVKGVMSFRGIGGAAEFLAQFWQKRPCLIRQAFAEFKSPLDADDLAGLACEEMAEARLVSGSFEARDWRLRHGPFNAEDFAALPEHNWTLLVQDVEKHYAPLQSFMHHFSFIPDWRIDDLMISYAVCGGSVGPHADQYDVFLLQAEGSRRWQIATSFQAELLEAGPLNVLRTFAPEQEWILEPGDMLYLPPNVAHHGIALEAGMTWSIGSRAPSAADLLLGLGEWLARSENEGGRYSDPGLKPSRRAGELNTRALRGLRDIMLSQFKSGEHLDNYLADFISRFRMAHEPVPPPVQLEPGDVLSALGEGEKLYRNPWTRMCWIRVPAGARLFAAGQAYECSARLAEALCNRVRPQINANGLDRGALEVISRMINDGHLAFYPG